MIRDIIAMVLMAGGMAFLLIAAIGVFRLPDPFLRLHASTKAGTLGAGLLVAGVAVAFREDNLGFTAAAIILFLLATLPVAGHLLGRAMYVSGADIVMNVASNTGNGILEAAYEAKKYAIGVDLNQDETYPGHILTSMLKRVDMGSYLIVKAVVEGNFEGGKILDMTIANGGVGLTDPSFDTPARVEHPVDGERGRFPLLRVIFRGVRDADAGRPGV